MHAVAPCVQARSVIVDMECGVIHDMLKGPLGDVLDTQVCGECFVHVSLTNGLGGLRGVGSTHWLKDAGDGVWREANECHTCGY